MWLVAYHSFHQNGHPDDAYAVFGRLHAAEVLTPTVDDVLLLTEETPESLLQRLKEVAPDLLAEARANPGHEAFRTWGKSDDLGEAAMLVDMVVVDEEKAEQGWVGITLPKEVAWPAGGLFDIAAALLPPGVTPTPCDKVGPRPLRTGEYAYTWETYPES